MYLAFFATYERIWHFLLLTSGSGIFCHLRVYLAFFATYERIWHFLPLTSVSEFQWLYLTVTYLEAQMIFPVMSLLNDTSIWAFNIVKFYSFLIMSHGIVLSQICQIRS